MKCKKHTRYKGILKPRCVCEKCDIVYQTTQRIYKNSINFVSSVRKAFGQKEDSKQDKEIAWGITAKMMKVQR